MRMLIRDTGTLGLSGIQGRSAIHPGSLPDVFVPGQRLIPYKRSVAGEQEYVFSLIWSVAHSCQCQLTLSLSVPPPEASPSSFVRTEETYEESYPTARVVFDFTPSSEFELAVRGTC